MPGAWLPPAAGGTLAGGGARQAHRRSGRVRHRLRSQQLLGELLAIPSWFSRLPLGLNFRRRRRAVGRNHQSGDQPTEAAGLALAYEVDSSFTADVCLCQAPVQQAKASALLLNWTSVTLLGCCPPMSKLEEARLVTTGSDRCHVCVAQGAGGAARAATQVAVAAQHDCSTNLVQSTVEPFPPQAKAAGS